MARNASSPTTRIVRPKSLALRPMPRRSAGACGRAWSRRISPASGSCWNCSSTASSSPTKRWRSVTSSPSDRRVSATRFVYCEQTIKSVFQVHGVAADGTVAVRRRLRRRDVPGFLAGLPPCLVGIEASRSAHYWGRELAALGHTVKLMPPSYVKPYVKRNKNDAADAEAICEAVARPTMRFVPVKSREQQAAILLHRARDLLIRQRTQLVNALRSHLAEFGIVGPQGLWNVKRLVDAVRDGGLPAAAQRALTPLTEQLDSLKAQIAAIEKDIRAWHREHEACRRLAAVPGIGPITASAIVATVPDV